MVSPVDDVCESRIAQTLRGEHPGTFELEHEPRQGVREHVVHLPGESLALGQPCGACFGSPALLQLDEELLGLLVRLAQPVRQERPPDEAAEYPEQWEAGTPPADPRDHRQDHKGDDRHADRFPPWQEPGNKEDTDDSRASERPAGTHQADNEPGEANRHGKVPAGQTRGRVGTEPGRHDEDEQGREEQAEPSPDRHLQ